MLDNSLDDGRRGCGTTPENNLRYKFFFFFLPFLCGQWHSASGFFFFSYIPDSRSVFRREFNIIIVLQFKQPSVFLHTRPGKKKITQRAEKRAAMYNDACFWRGYYLKRYKKKSVFYVFESVDLFLFFLKTTD